MIRAAMAVAAATAPRSDAAEYAREARWARFAALVLDGIFLSIVNAFVNAVYGVTVVTSGYISATGGGYLTTTQTIPAPVLVLLGFIYFIVSEAMFGATPGKQLMRVKVVRLDGRPLTLAAVVVRNALRFVDFLPFAYLAGGFLVLATPRAQRIGDMAAGTAVAYRHRVSEMGQTRSSSARARIALVAVLLIATIFSIGFDYFGRPPLVVEGMFNEHRLFEVDVTSYSLGQPTWGAGTVTYPFVIRRPNQSCSGTMTLRRDTWDWQLTDATYVCPPS